MINEKFVQRRESYTASVNTMTYTPDDRSLHPIIREDILEAVVPEGISQVRKRRAFQKRTIFTMTRKSEECGSLGRTVYRWVWM